MLEFDTETARILENSYLGADITGRRRVSFDILDPRPGEKLLDIGCGNGLLTAELARAVGLAGQVTGVDPSKDMRGPAIERCQEYEWVRIANGDAETLPVGDESIDKAVSIQVFEYLNDIPAALVEVYRVLKPGGRLVIADMHFDTLIWFSENPDRMEKMKASWNEHCVETGLPEVLHSLMQRAGFTIETIRPVVFCDHVLKSDGIAIMMLRLMERYAIQKGHLPEDDVRAWRAEQEKLAQEGRFFFSFNHYVVSARKP